MDNHYAIQVIHQQYSRLISNMYLSELYSLIEFTSNLSVSFRFSHLILLYGLKMLLRMIFKNDFKHCIPTYSTTAKIITRME